MSSLQNSDKRLNIRRTGTEKPQPIAASKYVPHCESNNGDPTLGNKTMQKVGWLGDFWDRIRMATFDSIIKVTVTTCSLLGLIFSMVYIEKKYDTLLCQQIEIDIQEHFAQSFTTKATLMHLINQSCNRLIGTSLQEIDLYALHHTLKALPFVKNILIFKTWQGNLNFFLETKYFIARSIRRQDGDFYIDKDGACVAMQGLPIFPFILVDGLDNLTGQLDNKIHHKELLRMLNYIHADPFFSYQIATLQVLENHKIILGTQEGKQRIEFGKIEKIEEKFEKLRLFYNQVVPYKGRERYTRINIEFENQLICE